MKIIRENVKKIFKTEKKEKESWDEKKLEIGIENFLFFKNFGARTTIFTRDSI